MIAKHTMPFFVKILVLTAVFFTISPNLLPAQDLSEDQKAELQTAETKINLLIKTILQSDTPRVRNVLNQALLKTLADALRLDGAIRYSFKDLDVLGDVTSPSGDFRMFSWELADENGKNRYYACALYLESERWYVDQFEESREGKEISEFGAFTPENWYGCMYFDILEVNHKKERYYLLLGINREELLVEKKVIEPVYIRNGLHFGKEVFHFPEQDKFKRKIYRYSTETTMSIRFKQDDERIVMDHLSPEKPAFVGRFEHYVPDLSFDALELKKDVWNYIPDFDAKMEKNLKDRYYEMELPEQEKMY